MDSHTGYPRYSAFSRTGSSMHSPHQLGLRPPGAAQTAGARVGESLTLSPFSRGRENLGEQMPAEEIAFDLIRDGDTWFSSDPPLYSSKAPFQPSHLDAPSYTPHSRLSLSPTSLSPHPFPIRHPHPRTAAMSSASSSSALPSHDAQPTTSIRIDDLEVWMDDAYGFQLCALMGWKDTVVKVPAPFPGQDANNPGYCFVTFPSVADATRAIAQVTGAGTGSPLLLPNSNRRFNVSWVPHEIVTAAPIAPPRIPGRFPQEFSIFVGDLSLEATSSDLVAVFRNPTLGLRPDREPRFIRPFHSCKSAKIMVDPVTNMSRGFGFVRFSEETDQQRALIEMQGLYCLSRPMRISHATAKNKPAGPSDVNNAQPPPTPFRATPPRHTPSPPQWRSQTFPQPQPRLQPEASAHRARSVSSPLTVLKQSSSLPPLPTSTSNNEISLSNKPPSSRGSMSDAAQESPHSSAALAQIAQLASVAMRPTSSSTSTTTSSSTYSLESEQSLFSPYGGAESTEDESRYEEYDANVSEDTAKPANAGDIDLKQLQLQQAQARALLATMIGPNGGVLNSTDPYNTTVFVGGLSPLISEDTLRTFFAPFGEIHYVKIPPGKGCGFVQFVHKPDAIQAIEKMQGFPIGGSKVRLSWGKSQSDKAAQAAAQAAQLGLNLGGLGTLNGLSVEHTAQLLQSVGLSDPLQVQALSLANQQNLLSNSISSERRGSDGSTEGSQRETEGHLANSVPILSRGANTLETSANGESRGLKRAATLPSSTNFGSAFAPARETMHNSFTYDGSLGSTNIPATSFGTWNTTSFRSITPNEISSLPMNAQAQDFLPRSYPGIFANQPFSPTESFTNANLLGGSGPFSDFSSFKASDVLRNPGGSLGRNSGDSQMQQYQQGFELGIGSSSSNSSIATSISRAPSSIPTSASNSSQDHHGDNDHIISSFKMLNLDEDEPMPKSATTSTIASITKAAIMRPALPRSSTHPLSFESGGTNMGSGVRGPVSTINEKGTTSGTIVEGMQIGLN